MDSTAFKTGITSSVASLLALINLAYSSVADSSMSWSGWNLLRTLIVYWLSQGRVRAQHFPIVLLLSLYIFSFSKAKSYFCRDDYVIVAYTCECVVSLCIQHTVLPLSTN